MIHAFKRLCRITETSSNIHFWLIDLFTLSVSAQPHKQLEIIVCIILYQVPLHKSCNTIVLDNVQMHPFLIPKISMLIASHNAHLHAFTIAAPHTWLHGSVYKEGIPNSRILGLNLVFCRWCTEGRWGVPGCFLIHNVTSSITYSRISSVIPPHTRKIRTTVK